MAARVGLCRSHHREIPVTQGRSHTPRHNPEVGIMVVVPTSAQPPAPSRPRDRDGPRRRPPRRHPAPTWACSSRGHLDLSARDRQRGNHSHRPRATPAGDPGHRRSANDSVARGPEPPHNRDLPATATAQTTTDRRLDLASSPTHAASSPVNRTAYAAPTVPPRPRAASGPQPRRDGTRPSPARKPGRRREQGSRHRMQNRSDA